MTAVMDGSPVFPAVGGSNQMEQMEQMEPTMATQDPDDTRFMTRPRFCCVACSTVIVSNGG